MKLNNKGIAITLMLYTVFTIAVLVFIGTIFIMSSYKKINGALINNIKTELNDALLYKASKPELYDGLIPVYYNGTNWIVADKNSDNWYNYDNQIWANAITVNSNVRNNYKTVGKTVNMNEVLTMFVWVPRYEYTMYKGIDGSNIYNGGTSDQPGLIDVRFVSKTAPKRNNVPSYTSLARGYNVRNYMTHKAFTFGDTELSGIWVGKFETSYSGNTFNGSINPGTGIEGNPASDNFLNCLDNECFTIVKDVLGKNTSVSMSDELRIIPDSIALGYNNVSNFFKSSFGMKRVGNAFGFSQAIDTHLIKNSEWGAVAYLSQSKYGKAGNLNYTGIQKEIYINNSEGFYTGRSGGSFLTSGIQKTTTQQYGTGNTDKFNMKGYYTYDGRAISADGTISTRITDTKAGYGASTTGTIYGIYDMSGGKWEYVMGWLSTASSTFGGSSNGNHAGFTTNPGYKYWDNYMTTNPKTACDRGICYGDSLSEITQWYKDYKYFVESSSSWFVRGGNHHDDVSAGIFNIRDFNGRADAYLHSRTVLTAK